jgi:dipeptidyl aminopeptidase/acylaminoacyl peptidase
MSAATSRGSSGLTCSFNASGSSDPDGTIASYAWAFGAVTVALRSVGPRIAFDRCRADGNNWVVVCDTHILVDGSETRLVSGQVGAKWSPDGSRIAFTDGSHHDLTVTATEPPSP